MKIVYLSGGARSRALRYLLEKGENVVAVITPCLSTNNKRFMEVIQVAVEYGVPVYSVNKTNLYEILTNIDYNILVSCGFSYVIDNDSLSTAEYAINVHPTLLPAYRGFRSGPYIIMNGESRSGVTIHWLTSEVDKGDILAQESFPLSIFETTRSMIRKCQDVEPELLYRVIESIKQGTFVATPQDESQASTYSHIRMPEDSEIDPKKSLMELYNEIRACDADDYPAFFILDGQKVCIKLWRPEKAESERDLI